MKEQETRCIICGNRRDGLEVRMDGVISAIRWFKENVTRNAKGYRLVVCKECYPKYAKDRKKFQSRQIFYVALGVIFAGVLLFGASSGGNLPLVILYSIAIVVFVYLLSLLTYVPAVNIPNSASSNAGRKRKIV